MEHVVPGSCIYVFSYTRVYVFVGYAGHLTTVTTHSVTRYYSFLHGSIFALLVLVLLALQFGCWWSLNLDHDQ